ncbi:hypothetical protein SAMN04488498_10660 [Mesorhizobium albiziae]|uniref:Antitoxin n=1 Tax=Neomesorhizobium albiziae TaxID=335020 RepID=A0A1I3ZBZ9_9HYPH|nr:hypothetical protein [Mesorhizobium albiziae]SFK41099.1 hypothetical protein SAMN04488498_10660 [Mesorhizobium albiziae]
MKNVTISMDDELHRTTRIEAAKAGKSVSRYIADRLRQPSREEPDNTEEEARKRRLEALERFFAGPKLNISENGRMPTAEERNARR